MIFLTVGTQFGFDRLVKAVDECIANGLIVDDVFAQIGPGSYLPCGMESVASLDRDSLVRMVQKSDAIVSHAGMGGIELAIAHRKPLLVMPRRKKYREAVNDHQIETARRFEMLGQILVAYDTGELADKIPLLKEFVPIPREPNRRGIVEKIMKSLELRFLDRGA